MLRSGLRILVMGGLVLSLAACDKCGDYLKINTPSIPKSCTDSAPAQK